MRFCNNRECLLNSLLTCFCKAYSLIPCTVVTVLSWCNCFKIGINNVTLCVKENEIISLVFVNVVNLLSLRNITNKSFIYQFM